METKENGIIRRYFPGKLENRMDGGSKTERFGGLAATTGSEYVLWEDSEDVFTEVIERGAFRDVEKFDVRVLKNHDSNYLLARTANGTARVWEDKDGLHYEWDNDPMMSYAADIAASIRRGDTNQSSFGFIIGEEMWEREKRSDGKMLHKRTIRGFKEVFDVSPVTFPANQATTVEKRSLLKEETQSYIINSTKLSWQDEIEFYKLRTATKEKLLHY